MKLSDGLFLSSIRTVAEKYPEIEYRELIVDNACMQLVMNPAQFDMLLLPNLYGDVVSDPPASWEDWAWCPAAISAMLRHCLKLCTGPRRISSEKDCQSDTDRQCQPR